MSALVAKSYANLEQLCEPYEVNGKMYVKVRMANGSSKTVRAYSEKEYAKYNPEVKIIKPAKSQRDTFGFGDAGFIWIFKGDTYSALDWFRFQPTRYARMWGWYLPSDMEMPDPLPAGITPVKLPWDVVCNEEGNHIKDEKEVEKIAATYLYDEGTSKWLGQVGDRIKKVEVVCTHIANIMGFYGESSIISFRTDDGDNLMWTTTSKQQVEEEGRYLLSGTIKKLDTYKGSKQTVLTRCKVEEINS